MNRGKWVALAGGLGNQLFQYAYSLSNLRESEVSTLECVGFSLGAGETKVPEIGKFRLFQARISLDNWSNTQLEQRSFNYLLRASTHRDLIRKFDPFSLLARAVITPRIILMYMYKPDNAQLKSSNHSSHLEIGYFQDKRITEEVLIRMKNLTLQQKSVILIDYVAASAREKPLVLHIRRGDYRSNPDLGCLSENYYRKLLDQVWSEGQFGKIWLFSDDPESSLDMIDQSLHRFIRVIDQEISTAETFEIMRLGFGYIIANSSFSFWAAALRRNDDCVVYAPAPWFRKTLFPDENFPSDWILVPAGFEA